MHTNFMRQAIVLAQDAIDHDNGGPFGAIIVKEGSVIAQGHNAVTSSNDPTMHAEIMAIRKACAMLGTFNLTGCTLYSSCEPCPMCIGAIYWAHLDTIYYGATKTDAAQIGFDDTYIYQELSLTKEKRRLPMHQIMHNEAVNVLRKWEQKKDKVTY